MKLARLLRLTKPQKRLLIATLCDALSVASLLAMIMLVYLTGAVFGDTQATGSNTFTTKPDWVAPTLNSAAIVNSIGNVGRLRQGDTYRVCASLTDSGNPASGVNTVTANVAVTSYVITTGETAATLTSGEYTCETQSFIYQSAVLTADASLAEGTKTFQITGTDFASNSSTTGWTVTIDNTSPTTSSFATTNAGTAGLIEAGDTLAVIVSEAVIDLAHVKAGWNGSSTAVFVKLLNNGNGSGKDGLWVCIADTANCAGGTNEDELLGGVNLNNADYVTNTVTFYATLLWTVGAKKFTVTIGSCASGCGGLGTGGSSTATFTPRSGADLGGIRDKAGNNMSTSSTAQETGVQF